jgi:signal transduction histidine kinase
MRKYLWPSSGGPNASVRPPGFASQRGDRASPGAARPSSRRGPRTAAILPFPTNQPATEAVENAGFSPATWLWAAGFAIAAYVFSLPQLALTVPETGLHLISIPMGLLAAVLIVRPRKEAPIYGLIYAAISLGFALRADGVGFALAKVALETGQTFLVVCMLFHFFFHRFQEPMMVAAWAVAALALTAFSAFLMLVAASLLPMTQSEYAFELASNPWMAWRYWWLGNACTYLAVAGPIATLINLRHRLTLLVTTPGDDRRKFFGGAAALLVVSLIAFPINDMSWVGLPAEVAVATHLLPVPFAMAMATRFRANGASVAILIFTLIAAVSVVGPNQNANWPGPVCPVTPTQTLLLVTTITCMVLSSISRQLKMALNEALKASEMKSRFIAMLHHELRTPLNAILGFSELMRLQSVRALDDALGPIENIHASGQRLLAMIEGLLGQADHGASVFDLAKQPLPVAVAMSGAIADLRTELELLGCGVTLSITEELVVDADPRALKQILHVLLGFPLRFVGPDTVIMMSAAHYGTDTVIEVNSRGLINAAADDRDKLEMQLVEALALAHGARLKIVQTGRNGRIARLTFFATRAAA